MGAMASQITSLTIVYPTVYSGADQRKRQSSASLAFVWGIHRWPVNSPHKGPVTQKMIPFDDVMRKYPPILYLTVSIPSCSTFEPSWSGVGPLESAPRLAIWPPRTLQRTSIPQRPHHSRLIPARLRPQVPATSALDVMSVRNETLGTVIWDIIS